MSVRVTLATAQRVLWQIRHDPRTIALLLVVPAVLLVLLRYVLDGRPARLPGVGAPLCGLFPFIAMFLVTSIAMLRERTTGTLERLMTCRWPSSTCWPATRSRSARSRRAGGRRVHGRLRRTRASTPARRLAGRRAGGRQRGARDGARAVRQRVRADRVPGGAVHARVRPPAAAAVRAVRARDQMAPRAAGGVRALPFTYAYDALARATDPATLGWQVGVDTAIVLGAGLLSLGLGALTLHRRTA